MDVDCSAQGAVKAALMVDPSTDLTVILSLQYSLTKASIDSSGGCLGSASVAQCPQALITFLGPLGSCMICIHLISRGSVIGAI